MMPRVYIHRKIAEETKGKYLLPLSTEHLEELLTEMVPAPRDFVDTTRPTLVRHLCRNRSF